MARPRVHLLTSLALSAYQYSRTRKLMPAVAPLLTGFLIDGDHLLDHWLHSRSTTEGKPPVHRLVLPLHGYEYLPVLFFAERRFFGDRTAGGLFLGLIVHYAIDVLTNKTAHPLTYSLAFRALNGFRGTLFGGEPAEHSWRNTAIADLWRWF